MPPLRNLLYSERSIVCAYRVCDGEGQGDRPTVAQLKRAAKLSTIIGLTTMHAVCHRMSML